MAAEPGDVKVYEIKKYPNRRFYDVTRSRHVTLNELYDIVLGGDRIVVHDSKTGKDITNVVLTQIILEHDPPKLDLFPASLLHQAIQSNQQMVRRFIDQYFAQAVDAFARSRQQFDNFLSKSGFSPLSPTAPFDWVRMLIPDAGGGSTRSPSTRGEPHGDSEARNAVTSARMQEELSAMRAELDALKKTGGAKKRSTGKRRSSTPLKKKRGRQD